jgi:DNA-binding FadR family transcriptional regulator
MLTKSLETASQIPSHGPRKAAILLAAEFERAILVHHREGRDVFGPERDLATAYNASPKAVRQALRILESRFLGTVRRGVHGGLALRVPVMEESAELMAIYLSTISAGLHDVINARDMMLEDINRRPAHGRNFALTVLSSLAETFSRTDRHQPIGGHTRALVIAHRIVADRQTSPMDGRSRIGTLEELEEKHSSGRPVILQAVRILEELEMIEMVHGRGGGIALRTPSPGAIVRSLYPHFVLQRLTMEASRDIIWSINLATATYAAQHRSEDQAQALRSARERLIAGDFAAGDHSGQVLIWRMLGDVAGNQVLHMLARCIFYFQFQSDAVMLERILEPLPEVLRSHMCDLALAVCEGDVARARHAVTLCENIARA